MMWDNSYDDRAYPPPMQMPFPSYTTTEYVDPNKYPFPQGYHSQNFPSYFSQPVYERIIYYGDAPPPTSFTNPSYPPRIRTQSFSYQQPEPEPYIRTRATSHSHHKQPEPEPYIRTRATSHSHHHHPPHSHSHHHHPSHHPSAAVHPPQAPTPRPAQVKPPAAPRVRIAKPSSRSHLRPPQPSPSQGPLVKGHPDFLYSKCTGRKKALCIGINYRGQPHELRGCINDAEHMRNFLVKQYRYRAGDIVMLTDNAKNPRQQPTRQNIIDAMRWLVRSAKPHDSLFFHYSGHGGQTKDLNGDEIDGYDEVIYPVDFQKNGHIIDDDLNAIMVQPLPAGCRLTAVFDSCHSGTVLDLPFIYTSHGRMKGSNITSRFRKQLTTPSDVISWSACKDGQTSADTFSGKEPVGAMSNAFIYSLSGLKAFRDVTSKFTSVVFEQFSAEPEAVLSGIVEIGQVDLETQV